MLLKELRFVCNLCNQTFETEKMAESHEKRCLEIQEKEKEKEKRIRVFKRLLKEFDRNYLDYTGSIIKYYKLKSYRYESPPELKFELKLNFVYNPDELFSAFLLKLNMLYEYLNSKGFRVIWDEFPVLKCHINIGKFTLLMVEGER